MKLLKLLCVLVVLYTVSACEDNASAPKCAKARFVGKSCQGVWLDVMGGDLLDEKFRTWGSSSYRALLHASVDTTLLKIPFDGKTLFTSDSVFYFSYRNGELPRAEFSICSETAPEITILTVSDTPCKEEISDR